MASSIPNSMNQIIGNMSVYRDGSEKISYTLYHYIAYPTSGQLNFQFFGQVQGLTLADTNLELNGQLPVNKAFVVEAIETDFISGQPPSATPASDAADAAINDAFNVLSNGYGQLTLGDKEYGTFAPLYDAPSKTALRLDGFATDSSTPAANQHQTNRLLTAQGRQWRLASPVLIPNNSTFGVHVGFSSLVPITSQARLGVKLRGTLIRLSQ